MAGFHIEHFGCRAARADGEAIAGNLRALHAREPFAADVVIVNTCSVTAEADRAARAFIRRAHRKNPAAKIVVTGCYAQRAPEELAAMAGVAAVVGNSHKALTPEIILDLTRGTERAHERASAAGACGATAGSEIESASHPSGQTIASRIRLLRTCTGARRSQARRADAAQPEDPGRLRQPLHVLRDPFHARSVSESALRSSHATGGEFCRCGRQGTGALRHQPWAVGKGFGVRP